MTVYVEDRVDIPSLMAHAFEGLAEAHQNLADTAFGEGYVVGCNESQIWNEAINYVEQRVEKVMDSAGIDFAYGPIAGDIRAVIRGSARRVEK